MRIVGDLLFEFKDGGFAAAYTYVRRRLFARSLMLVYECKFEKGNEPDADVRIDVIRPEQIDGYQKHFDALGIGSDSRNSQRGAFCFLLFKDSEPAAVGWMFFDSRLLRCLKYRADSVYFGGFLTKAEFRGNGYYPVLLNYMVGYAGKDVVCVAETSLENTASQRGLVKAGFKLAGAVRRVVFAGVMVKCELTASCFGGAELSGKV